MKNFRYEDKYTKKFRIFTSSKIPTAAGSEDDTLNRKAIHRTNKKIPVMEKKTRTLPIVERDAWLQPVENLVEARHERYLRKLREIGHSGSLVDYANGYRYFGWQWDDTLDGWWLREWLPGAHDVYVFGDFNNWQRTEIRMHKDSAGVWSAFFQRRCTATG